MTPGRARWLSAKSALLRLTLGSLHSVPLSGLVTAPLAQTDLRCSVTSAVQPTRRPPRSPPPFSNFLNLTSYFLNTMNLQLALVIKRQITTLLQSFENLVQPCIAGS